MTVEERLESLSQRLSKLESKARDPWDKFQIVATAMVPVMLAIFGYYYTQTMKDAELASAREISDREQAIASINARVGQAQLVDSLMDELLSNDSNRKQLAIKAVLVFLKEEGQELVAAISRADPNPEVRQYAANTLMDRRSQLIRDIFAENADLRKSSTAELARGWHSDQQLIPELLKAGRAQPKHASGVINTLEVLRYVDRKLLLEHETDVRPFLAEVEGNGPMTRDRANLIRARFARASQANPRE